MKKLFVSFTGLLKYLQEESITEEDLHKGLFFFGCVREHVLGEVDYSCTRFGGDTACSEWIVMLRRSKPELTVRYVELIRSVLLRAEAEGRCIWRDENSSQTDIYEILNELLERHGVQRLLSPPGPMFFSYPAVKAASKGVIDVYF